MLHLPHGLPETPETLKRFQLFAPSSFLKVTPFAGVMKQVGEDDDDDEF